MQLKKGTSLKFGSYVIESVLGQGGFGITYMALQTGLNRKVAIKEFFMREHCERDEDTSEVSLGTSGSREMVLRFKNKFIREAQTIAEMENDHIIRIYDVFEENGTAYYVMEFLQGGSLADSLPSGGFPEKVALKYLRQIADALQYIHEEKNILHLDVKPANVMLRKEGVAVLIDFGISKHYDEEGGSQTSSTPVGVSKGYAPLEQYKTGGVSQFSPATDVYSLGATLYKLLTGQTPPDANDVNEDGLPDLLETISAPVRAAIEKAMEPRRKDRPQSVAEFLALLDVATKEDDERKEDEIAVQDDQDETDVVVSEHDETEEQSSDSTSDSVPGPAPRKRRLWLWLLALVAGVLAAAVFFGKTDGTPETSVEHPMANEVCVDVAEPTTSDLVPDSFGENEAAVPESTTATSGTISGHAWFDLGLPSGLKWATCNVGASSPGDYGDYYAWGNLEPMTDQYSGTLCRENTNISGNPEYDVARSKWGGSWRMPTWEEFEELIYNCSWEWTTKDSHNGYKVTGPNGNSIFFPAAGFRYGADTYGAESDGDYWSATPDYKRYAYKLLFNSDGPYRSWSTYYVNGQSVRPVSD